MMDRLDAAPGILGIAVSGTRVAQILYPRVARIAFAAGKPVARVLGIVIAHELGHLLLPPQSHSREGLMRASLNLQLAAARLLGFTLDQGALIRARVSEQPHMARGN